MRSKRDKILEKAGRALLAVSAWVFTSVVLGLVALAVADFFWYMVVALSCTAPLSGMWHFAARLRTGKRRVFKEYLYFLLLFHACLLVSGFFLEEDFAAWAWEISWRMSFLYGIMAAQSALVDFLLNLCEDNRAGRV